MRGTPARRLKLCPLRCCYCYYWNPARKQRPVAPRLTPAAERPAVLSASDSSGQLEKDWTCLAKPHFNPRYSGSDISAPNSAPASRRESVSERAPAEEKPVETTGQMEEENQVVEEREENQAESNLEVQSEEVTTNSSVPDQEQVNEEPTVTEEIKEEVSETEVEEREKENNEEINTVEKTKEEKLETEANSNCDNEMDVDS